MLIFQTSRPKQLTSLLVATIISRGNNGKAVYQVNGASLTFEQCQKVAPESRTVAHWQVLLDWERQRTQPYVIVDPFDPSGLLYFSEVEYKIQARTLGSMNTPFIVVARPGSARPPVQQSPSQNTPPHSNWKLGKDLFEEFDPITWRSMKDLRSFIARNVKWSKTGAVRVNDRNIMGLIWLWSRELFHQLGENGWAKRQGQLVAFVRHLQNVLRHNGSAFTIQRLKITLFALYSWVGGNPLKSTNELGQRVRLRNGLPTWLPRNALRRSKKTGLRAIRLWASLLNIYKYLHGAHPEPPLETIMAPPYTGPEWDFYQFIERDFYFRLNRLFTIEEFEYKSAKGLVINSAGANHPVSMLSIPADAYAWNHSTINDVDDWFKLWGDDEMRKLLKESESKFDPMCRVKGGCTSCLCKPRLGRLHPIQEAAGKVRVVAICDYFTQVALKPVHDWLFDLLRKIPTDATFGQQESFDFFQLQGHKEIFSFDLKAATDLIPIELYRIVMREVLGFVGVEVWIRLLTKRDFFAAPDAFGLPAREELAPDGFLVRYTRGQPMGALSSWASLALLHHALVQFAASRVGIAEWFQEYLVLGDDIVIGQEKVALSYLEVCKEFGITVGLPKSLTSREGLMNFAAQTAIRNQNISPLSLKEEISAQNVPMRIALVERVLHRWGGDRTGHGYLKRILTEPQWSAVSDGGIRGSGSRNLNLVRFLVESPFKDEETVTTGNVISWLGYVDPELRKLPNGVRQDLEEALIAYALDDLLRLLNKRLNNMASVKNHIRSFIYERDRVVDTIELPPISTEDIKPLVPSEPDSIDKVYLTRGGVPGLRLNRLFGLENNSYTEYLLESIERRLDTVVWSKLKELRKELKPYLYRLVIDENEDFHLPENCPTYSSIVTWYNRLMAIPNPILEKGMNRERSLYSLFSALPDETAGPFSQKGFTASWKKVKESLKGPVGSVCKAVAKTLGEILPIDAILHRDSSSIHGILRRIRAEMLARRATRDASPAMAPQLMALVPWSPKGWFYHDPGVGYHAPFWGSYSEPLDAIPVREPAKPDWVFPNRCFTADETLSDEEILSSMKTEEGSAHTDRPINLREKLLRERPPRASAPDGRLYQPGDIDWSKYEPDQASSEPNKGANRVKTGNKPPWDVTIDFSEYRRRKEQNIKWSVTCEYGASSKEEHRYSSQDVPFESVPGFKCKCGVQDVHCPHLNPPGNVECWNPDFRPIPYTVTTDASGKKVRVATIQDLLKWMAGS